MTLLETTLEEEVQQQNATINAVTTYYKFEERGACSAYRKRLVTRVARLIKIEEATQPITTNPAKQSLNETMLLVF